MNRKKKMNREKINKYAFELGCSIFDNEPNLHPGNLTMDTVRFYAEGGGFDDLTDKEFEELIRVTFYAEHIVHVPTK